ncbi:hypothetical protein 031MP004_45 [Bacillus phage 031MP004]|nr:hypothetical protein 031MP004_45 [Bacillus phage 031MP004]
MIMAVRYYTGSELVGKKVLLYLRGDKFNGIECEVTASAEDIIGEYIDIKNDEYGWKRFHHFEIDYVTPLGDVDKIMGEGTE